MLKFTPILLLLKKIIFTVLIIYCIGMLFPTKFLIPVRGASKESWDKKSYWYYPWGDSKTHKGIDIFAAKSTDVIAPTFGMIIKTKFTKNGGNIIYLLGPKWQVHYFAHLDSIYISSIKFVRKGQVIGTVGNTGNAKNKSPHLHYSIFNFTPYIWNYDEFAEDGLLKIFYLNPEEYFE